VLRWRWQQLKIKARICSEKGVRVSDPVLAQMTKPRWLFEAWQLKLKDERFSQLVQQVGEQGLKGLLQILVGVLGLNLEPIGEKDPVDPEKTVYRWPKADEWTPLIFAIARPDYLKSAMEKVESMMPVVGSSDAALSGDDATEEDLEFFDTMDIDAKRAFWNSLDTQQKLAQTVILKDPKEVDPNARPTSQGPSPAEVRASLERDARRPTKRGRLQIIDDDDPVAGLGDPPEDP
jgi:hypothetical protein